ncbi:sodium:solute symporter family protein [Candidatus Cardinium hertigii]|nr:sodium:solute symporter family protein [Candidatus Cardinium hertigii]
MDVIIVALFLIITLVIGMYYGRGIKTFQEYAVGDRKMSSIVIAFSLVATIYEGGCLEVSLFNWYHRPFFTLAFTVIPVLFYIFFPRFFIVRMKEFLGHLSIAESMGSIYGPMVRMCVALLSIVYAIGLLTVQIKVGLDITKILLPNAGAYAAIILTLLFITYAAVGGARAVTYTDVYQFFIFCLCCPMVFFVLLYYTDAISITSWQRLQDIPQFSMSPWHWNIAPKKEVCYYAIFASLVYFRPSMIQRFYMASSIRKAVKIFNTIWISWLALAVIFLSIAMVLHLGNHPIQPNQNVLQYILEQTYFPFMKVMLITTSIALLMSSADSELHVVAVLFTNDIWPMLTRLVSYRISFIKVTRIAATVVGIISLVAALYTSTNKTEQLLLTTVCLYAPIYIILFFTCCGFRPRPITVLVTISIPTCITLFYLIYQGVMLSGTHFFVLLFSSITTLLLTHCLLPKRPHTGWIGIKDRSAWDLQKQEIKRWWQKRLQQLTSLVTKQYRAGLFPKQANTFILLGIYIIISTIISICYMQKTYFFPYVYVYMIVMAIGTIVALYPALHSYKKEGNVFLHWVWPGLLFLLFFGFNIQFAKLSHFSPMVCTLFVCHIGLSIILLSLEVSISMLCLAMMMHTYIPPHISFYSVFWKNFQSFSLELHFALVLLGIVVGGLGVYKSLRDKANAKLKILELTRSYEHKIALEAIYNQANRFRLDRTNGSNLLREMCKRLQAPSHYLYTHHQEKLGEEINIFMKKLRQFSSLLLQNAKAKYSLELNAKAVKSVAIESVITKTYRYLHEIKASIQLLLRGQTKVKKLLADPELFECFLTLNLMEISRSKQAVDHVVTLTIADTVLHYNKPIIPQSTGHGTLMLPALAFCMSTDTTVQKILSGYEVRDELTAFHLPKTEKEVYQTESRQIVQAHGGYTEIIDTESALTCLYVLPVAGTRVMHFKTYDPTDLVADKIAETPESLAQEKELIALLTTKTALTQEMVEKTIAFIKNVHGLTVRKSGLPFYTHPMAVAQILLEVTNDPSTILAGLLHDVVEDSSVTLNQLELMYGPEVASIVEIITHYNTSGYPWKLDNTENKNMLKQCKDIRIVQVKLADRLHNIRTLYARQLVDQKRIAQDTMNFYIPWGHKHNICSKWLAEMQRICENILGMAKKTHLE